MQNETAAEVEAPKPDYQNDNDLSGEVEVEEEQTEETETEVEVEGEEVEGEETEEEGESEPSEEDGEKQEKERPVKEAIKELEYKQKLEQYEQQLNQYSQYVQEQQQRQLQLEALRQKDPVAWLRENGLELDNLTDHIVNGGQKEPTTAELQQEIARMKQEQFQREQQKEQQKQIDAFKQETFDYIEQNGDADCPLVKQLGMQNDVFERIVDHAVKTKGREVLDYKIAAKSLNKELLQLRDSLNKAFESLNGNANKSSGEETGVKETKKPSVEKKTLTNDLDASPSQDPEEELTGEELFEYRLKKFKSMYEKNKE